MRADRTLALLVAADTVTAAHLRGRHGEGKPAILFGREWEIAEIKPVDGQLLVQLRAREREGPIMCSKCGSFDWDQPGGHGDPFECSSCPNRGWGDGVTF